MSGHASRTHEWIARALKAEGVDRVFGYMAEDNIHLMLGLHSAGVRVVQTRHELAAAGMADGSLKGFRQTEYLESTVERVVSAAGPDDLPARLVDGEPASMATIPNPPFAEVACAFGARGLTVDTLDALPEMIQAGEGLPLVVDVRIDREVRHPDLG